MHSTVSNPNPHHQDCVWSCEHVSHSRTLTSAATCKCCCLCNRSHLNRRFSRTSRAAGQISDIEFIEWLKSVPVGLQRLSSKSFHPYHPFRGAACPKVFSQGPWVTYTGMRGGGLPVSGPTCDKSPTPASRDFIGDQTRCMCSNSMHGMVALLRSGSTSQGSILTDALNLPPIRPVCMQA